MARSPGFLSSLRSTDHDFVAAIRLLDDYAQHIYPRRHHHENDLETPTRHFVPRFDLEEHEDTYELYGAFPGAKKEDIVVEANDDRNLQVSGVLPQTRKVAAQPNLSGENGESGVPMPANDNTDPFVTVQHHDLLKGDSEPHLERFGEVLDPNRASQKPPPKADELDLKRVEKHKQSSEPNRTQSSASKAAPEPETARFGDVFDPNAVFIDATEGKKKDQETAPPPQTKPKVRYLLAERQFGQFHRAFHFPSPIKKDEVTARLDNGILHITAPRAPVPPARKIEVVPVSASGAFIF